MAGATMLAEVGKGFVTDSAKSLLGTVTALLKEQIVLTWGFKDDLKEFKRKFNTIQSMVGNPATYDNPVLEGWLNKVKDLVFDAEDVLDEYGYEMLKRKVIANRYQYPSLRLNQSRGRNSSRLSQLKIKTKVRLAIFKSWSSNPLVFRTRMANKLKSLRNTWDEIINDANRLGIKPMKVSQSSKIKVVEAEPEAVHIRREHVDFERIVGRDIDKDEIINLLCHSKNLSQRLSVVGIYGMAGLGKTTISKAAFEADDVKVMFQPRIWVCVSHDFKFEILLKKMAEQLLGSGVSNNLSPEAVKREMKKELEGKKYLLVLDDIWDTFTEIWEPLRSVLQEFGGSCGTTLLVTSRSKEVLETLRTYNSDVAGGMKKAHTYEIGKLTKKESKKLFWQRVGYEESSDPVKKEVARSLLKRCDGVPLAIRTLGDMLCSRKHANDWVDIGNSEIWNENDDVYPSVKLSFLYLSSAAVKRCFAFCGIFKEDEEIEKDKLIQLWMANGLLQSPDDDKMEQVGEKYFDELLGNSLFQEPEFDGDWSLRKLISCKMHDVVHKLASNILQQESSCSSSSSVRTQFHLSQSVNDDDDEVLSGSSEKGGNKLRMLMLFGRCERLDKKVRLLDFKCLRALTLVDLSLIELPDSIGMLMHLRYLDISDNEELQSLPDGLTKLYYLQTLRIPDICRFPREINKLVKLRHISGSIDSIGIPEGLGMLSDLQTLPMIDLKEDWGGTLRELKSLNQLKGKITLMNLQVTNKEEAEEANLGSKQNIEFLRFAWGDDEGVSNSSRKEEDEKLLDALQPHPNLKGLSIIKYRADKLPDWVLEMKGSSSHSLSYLNYLKILDCDYITCLPHVRGLTHLQELYLASCSQVSTLETWTSIYDLPRLQMLKLGPFNPSLDTIFPPHPCPLNTPLSKSLRRLQLDGEGMDKVKCVPPQIQYLLSLEIFYIERFSSVEEIPEWLSNLTSLQKLGLYELPSLKRLPSVHAMQQLTQLVLLYIRRCPILEKECAKESGPQWPNIQHIHNISMFDNPH